MVPAVGGEIQLPLSNRLTTRVKAGGAHRGLMNGVVAVRTLTALALASLVAGGWLTLNETAQSGADDTKPIFEEMLAADETGDADSGDDQTEDERNSLPDTHSDESKDAPLDLPTGLIAGGAGALGSLTLAAAVSEVMRVTVLVALMAPMLARMKGNSEDLLTRGRILGYLEANAGIHFSALRDALGLANGVTAYHLHVLESQGEVISWRDGKLRRYAIATLSQEEVSRIRNPIAGTRLAILEVLANSGNVGLSGSDIRERLAISRQLLSHHLMELRNAELVEAASEARRPNWRLSETGHQTLGVSRKIARVEAAV